MWTYRQSTGAFGRDGVTLCAGYSGAGEGKNNPALEAEPDVGPIPAGQWSIGTAHESPNTGPVTMDLTPVGFDPHGRSEFRIHGDSVEHPGQASHGCIILPRAVREQVAASNDRDLEVAA